MERSFYGQTLKVSGSLRKHCGLPVYHGTDVTVDLWLQSDRIDKVVVLLVDAMGTSVLQKHLKEDAFLRKHMVKSISSVFPPTTTASTTSIRTGKTPSETGWLGWNQYFKEVDDNIILFFNSGQYTHTSYPNTVSKALPVVFTEDGLGGSGDSIWPGWSAHNPCQTFEEMWKRIISISLYENRKYVYAYWDQFDTWMHRNGPSDISTGEKLQEINAVCEKYAPQIPVGTGVIIIADHSQIDVEKHNLEDHPEIVECFSHLPGLEPRTVAFHIRQDRLEVFPSLFEKAYGNDFDLYTRQQILDLKLFGENSCERMHEFIGDYLAVAKGNISLLYGAEDKTVKGDHAGGRKEEAMVPLILYSGKKTYEKDNM